MRKVISLSRFERWLKWRSFSKRLKEVNHDKMDMKSTQVPWHMSGVDITSNSREENDRCNRGPWSSSALLDSLAVHPGGNLDTALLLHTLLSCCKTNVAPNGEQHPEVCLPLWALQVYEFGCYGTNARRTYHFDLVNLGHNLRHLTFWWTKT